MTEAARKAWAERAGRRAYADGKSVCDNPFLPVPGMKMRRDWMKAWNAAHMEHEEWVMEQYKGVEPG